MSAHGQKLPSPPSGTGREQPHPLRPRGAPRRSATSRWPACLHSLLDGEASDSLSPERFKLPVARFRHGRRRRGKIGGQ